jgi:phosphocarrier protein
MPEGMDWRDYNIIKKERCDMLSKTLTVVNPSGLHLRPAGVLSQTAMKFKCDVLIECGEKRIIAKSVLNVMAAGIKSGTEITLICDGEDEAAAMETISQAIERGLGEM